MTQEITTGIRRAATPPRPAGNRVASSGGRNSGDPILDKRDAPEAVGVQPLGFPSEADARHKSNGWHELHAVEMRGYTETLVQVDLALGASINIDPTKVQVWRILANGGNTIIFSPTVFPQPATQRTDAPERRKTWSAVVILDIPSSGDFPTFAGVKWSEGASQPNVTLPSGEAPPSYAGRYTFTFVFDPVLNDVLGHEGGIRF